MTSPSPPPDESLRPALEALSARDPLFGAAYAVCGLPPVRRQPRGFEGLVRMIAAQQVSAGAAKAIIARLEQQLGPLSPETALAAGEEGLRACGLSRPKIAYTLGLAERVREGALDFERLETLEEEAAIAELTAARGIGRWTAEVYLLFSLGRPDVFPAGDLALQVALQRLRRMRKRPDEKKTATLARRLWRPQRAAAARFLWHYYHHPGVPD